MAQVYVSAPQTALEKPIQELRAFCKTKLLRPNESEKITIKLKLRDFASFWPSESACVAEKGKYEIKVGASSKNIKLTTLVEVPENIVVDKISKVLYPNIKLEELHR